MKMKIYEVIEKIDDIRDAMDRVADEDAIELLEEYKDSLLNTTVDI